MIKLLTRLPAIGGGLLITLGLCLVIPTLSGQPDMEQVPTFTSPIRIAHFLEPLQPDPVKPEHEEKPPPPGTR